MNKHFSLRPVAGSVLLMLSTAHAGATTLSFDELAAGSTLSNQYAALGVTFSPNAFSGAGGPSGNWATNTDMTITSLSGSDIGNPLGTPVLASGNALRSFSGYLTEDGDASFRVSFTQPMAQVGATFAGVDVPADVHLMVYNGSTLLANVTSPVTTGQFALSYSGAGITSIVITPGSYNDWVAVDNISFAVPEPGTVAMLAAGLGVVLTRRRRAPR